MKRHFILPLILVFIFAAVADAQKIGWSKEYTFNTNTQLSVPQDYAVAYLNNLIIVDITEMNSYDLWGWLGSWFGWSQPGIEGRAYIKTAAEEKYYLDCRPSPGFTDFDIQLNESAWCELDDEFLKRSYGYTGSDTYVLQVKFVKAAGDKFTLKIDITEEFLGKARTVLNPGSASTTPTTLPSVGTGKTGDILIEFAGYESILQSAGFSNPWAAIKNKISVYNIKTPESLLPLEYVDDKKQIRIKGVTVGEAYIAEIAVGQNDTDQKYTDAKLMITDILDTDLQ